MNFEYNYEDFKDNFIEYQQYITESSIIEKSFRKYFIIVFCIIIMFGVMDVMSICQEVFSQGVIIVFGMYIYSTVFIIFIRKIESVGKKRFLSQFKDIDKTFRFTIEDNTIMRESELSTVKVPFESIEEIEILEKGIIILTKVSTAQIYIPKGIIPVNLDEFMKGFKDYNIKVQKVSNNMKSDNIKYTVFLFCLMACAVILSYFRLK